MVGVKALAHICISKRRLTGMSDRLANDTESVLASLEDPGVSW